MLEEWLAALVGYIPWNMIMIYCCVTFSYDNIMTTYSATNDNKVGIL